MDHTWSTERVVSQVVKLGVIILGLRYSGLKGYSESGLT